MDSVHMISTKDNPFNPFSQFDEWYSFDVRKGYNTCAYLARVAKSSDELSDEDQAQAIEEAMDQIVEFNLTGNYIKVTSDYKPSTDTVQDN